MNVHSESAGDPSRFRSLAELEQGLRALLRSPQDEGRVVLIVRRNEGGVREVLDWVRVTPEDGIPGDAWGRREERDPAAQITAMQADVAALIANGQPLILSGDGLFVDLNLSTENLPVGSRVAIGSAVLEVTPKPHNGCRKFSARFGPEALRFVSKPESRHLNLRGIYLRVVEAGEIRTGDAAKVLTRHKATSEGRVTRDAD